MTLLLKPLRELYEWMLSLGDKPFALIALALIAFAESIFFPLPLEILLIPMILGARDRMVLFVSVAATFSALGAIAGSLLAGMLEPYLLNIPRVEQTDLDSVKQTFDAYGIWAIAVGALTFIPFKITVIMAGLTEYNLFLLFIFSFLFRGFRYAVVGGLLYYLGEPAKRWIDKWFGWACLLGIVLFAMVVWYLTS
ncbi:MAG: YqaA family protein [Alphaproteobacteria bacterium]